MSQQFNVSPDKLQDGCGLYRRLRKIVAKSQPAFGQVHFMLPTLPRLPAVI
jgi:hypothetical protein